ncbi:MAG: molybdopterin-guanine dinucleotide biosynthesis protein B [Candidatus Zixiibacteriota bacterium]|nr:MAG: molybdopterin-guanine dinucleotide biosynthesis protein B [candidate division Zixibacteria bacterium]
MVELAVVGAKKSGKTEVIEGLVSYLVGRGCRVATVKHTSHSHRFDTRGKDSYRHRQAGAGLTIAVSGEEVAIFARPDMLDTRQLQDMIGRQIDIWLIEGDRRAGRPKVMVTRHLKEWSGGLPENIVATIGPERLADVTVHFDAGDYDGLGAFVSGTMLDKKMEIEK